MLDLFQTINQFSYLLDINLVAVQLFFIYLKLDSDQHFIP